MAVMNEQSDVIPTPNSGNDDWTKRWLDRALWGYPKLVEACPFSVLADARRRNLEEGESSISESATDASEGQHPELPSGGDTTRNPSQSPSPSHENQASTNEDVHPDVNDVYALEAENHPVDVFVQTTMESRAVSQEPSAELVGGESSVPCSADHMRDLQGLECTDKFVEENA